MYHFLCTWCKKITKQIYMVGNTETAAFTCDECDYVGSYKLSECKSDAQKREEERNKNSGYTPLK